jgi:hypothetical protein
MHPIYTPFRAPLPGEPETHAQRMARTDRQLEREKRERAALAAVDVAGEDWAAVGEAHDNSPVIQEVLKLHAPVLVDGCYIVCNECDYYSREDHMEWPCGTFRVIKELL